MAAGWRGVMTRRRSSRSRRRRQGFGRMLEALLAVIVLVFGLTALAIFQPVRTSVVHEEQREVGLSVLRALDTSEVMLQILTGTDWEADIERFLATAVSPGSYFSLRILRIIGDQEEQLNDEPISNIDPAELARLPSVSTTLFPVSPSVGGALAQQVFAQVDIILTIDTSGSMNAENKLVDAKQAAIDFVNLVGNATLGQGDPIWMGVVRFSSSPSVAQPLTSNFTLVRNAITGLTASGFTNIGSAFKMSTDQLLGSSRPAKRLIVFLTDGIANYYLNEVTNQNVDTDDLLAREYAERKALEAKALGINVYSIALGTELDPFVVKSLATDPSRFFYSPSGSQLSSIYQSIATQILTDAQISQGSIVFELLLAPGS